MDNLSHIIVVEPSCLFREGLIRILGQLGGQHCSAFSHVDEIELTSSVQSAHTLFLVNFGHDWAVASSGITYLKEHFPECPIVVLADCFNASDLVRATAAGAHGYLLNTMSCDALIKSIELAQLGEVVFPTEIVSLLSETARLQTSDPGTTSGSTRALSTREAEVLRCLSQGKSNKVIAREWGITEATVKVHVKAILRKFQVKNRTEAALWARDHGLGSGTGSQNVASFPSQRSLAAE